MFTISGSAVLTEQMHVDSCNVWEKLWNSSLNLRDKGCQWENAMIVSVMGAGGRDKIRTAMIQPVQAVKDPSFRSDLRLWQRVLMESKALQ
jgi:hypothetical protein